ncbi:calcium/calmodulin-dependent protein kinase cmkB [Physcia stellaris]|nr:calcium/calmodulin-dependent protein kinase cmkB [Physcia stellaris]
MGHQNILTLVDYFETMNNQIDCACKNTVYLVTDLALGGELFDRICRKGSYFESDAADLIRATLSAVAYLHDHGIVHRDLKPENLLFRTPEDNADLLIADFGLSRIMDEEAFHVLTTTCGTPGYMAPEIFKKTGHGKPVDVWAIGVITYFLLCGYTPFDRDSNLEEMQAILVADYSFTPLEYWRGVSRSAREFIKRCLTIEPTKRMTSHEALMHPWVTGGDGADEGDNKDLLPVIKKNFNARRTLHAAIDTIRAINKLREGGAAGMMDGAFSKDPNRQEGKYVGEGGDKMEIDSRGNARGQTEEQIQLQQRRVDETSKVLVAALAAEVALAAPAAVADVPEVAQGPAVKQSKPAFEFATHLLEPVSAMSAESAYLATHVPTPTSAVPAKDDTIALESTDGIGARCNDCVVSPPEGTSKSKPAPPPPTTPPSPPSTSSSSSVSGFNVGSPLTDITEMVTKPTPLPTTPPGVPTVSSSVVPAFSVGTPLTDQITGPSPDAYCWEADNGQVHCVWTYTHHKLAKRTDAPEPAGSLTEREAVSVPTTLVTAVKREEERKKPKHTPQEPHLPKFTRAA